MKTKKDYVTLKWGTLKSWHITSKKGRELLKRYSKDGVCISAILQKNTEEQKRAVCELIDLVPGRKIYMDWDGTYVSKKKAKEYVMNYGKECQ